jgi:selenophosphate synthase
LFSEYNNLGFDPLRWLPDCSNELNHEKFDDIADEFKNRNNLRIIPNHYSYFQYPEKKDAEIIRRVYKIDEKFRHEDLKTKKAVSILKYDKNTVNDDNLLVNEIKKISDSFDTKIEVDKVSIIPTNSKKDFQFILFDHIKTQRGNKTGYTIVTNSNTQATDVTQSIGSPIHMEISFTESISLLNNLGCFKDIKLYPIYDAPTDELLDDIRRNIDSYTAKYNYTFEDYSSLKLGSLFFGTTAVGNTHKELPNRYDLIEQDMQIISTDSLGLLACLGLYITTNLDDTVFQKMNKYGIDREKVYQLRDLALKSLTEPKISIGKIISKYLPDFENQFDLQSNILVTHPISKSGIASFVELSKLINSEIIIDQVPFIDNDIKNFVLKEHLISNVSASTPDTNMIIVSKDFATTIIEELSKHKFNPAIVGRIGKPGKVGVRFNKHF